ncbi:MAG: hypothetical protein L0177_11880 [Chloroflexi bacterium]|nr:hypothetical protein [Chloroflexota bacterium]
MAVYLHPWEWKTPDDNGPRWQIPGAAGAVLDMRNHAAAASPGLSTGYAFALMDSPPTHPDAVALGELDETLQASEAASIESLLGLGTGEIVARTPRLIIAELMQHHADYTRLARWTPIQPTIRGNLEVFLGRGLIAARRYFLTDDSYSDMLRQAIREAQYRPIWQAVQDGKLPPEHHRRLLTILMEKYRTTDYEQFIPADLPNETPLPRASTIGDTFVEASDTALASHTATGPNSGFSWTENVNTGGGGDLTVIAATDDIEANSNASGYYRANQSLDGGDHYSQMAVSMGSGGTRRNWSVLTRVEHTSAFGNAADADLFQFIVVDDSGNMAINVVTNNTATELASASASVSGTQTLKGESSGSSHTLYIDGVSKVTASDGSYTGQLRAGAQGRHNGTTLGRGDNFEAADLGGAPSGPPPGSLALLGVGI